MGWLRELRAVLGGCTEHVRTCAHAHDHRACFDVCREDVTIVALRLIQPSASPFACYAFLSPPTRDTRFNTKSQFSIQSADRGARDPKPRLCLPARPPDVNHHAMHHARLIKTTVSNCDPTRSSPRAPENGGPCRAPHRSPTGQASRGASGSWQRRTSTAQSCPARPHSHSRM